MLTPRLTTISTGEPARNEVTQLLGTELGDEKIPIKLDNNSSTLLGGLHDKALMQKVTTNSTGTKDANDKSWKTTAQQNENETLAYTFRTKTSDYPTYQHELSDSANDGFGPTHMLPIYCSIMGMIILTLLLYVFYKLWKQRDSLTNSKLSDGTYSVNSSLSRGKESSTVLINNSNNVVYTARAKQPAAYSSFHSSSVGEVNTNITEAKESYNSSLKNTNEREPLIRNTCVYSGDLNRPLDTVSLNILGFIGYQLYQKGWAELVTELSLNTLESELQAKYSTDEQPQSLSPLAKLCIDYKQQNENANLPESYNEKELICIAAVIIALVENNSVSLPSLINALCSIQREDLAHLLEQDSSVSVQVPLLTDGGKVVNTGVFAKDQDV